MNGQGAGNTEHERTTNAGTDAGISSSDNETDIFSLYFQYARAAPEAPDIYHRWCIISIIGALLSRSFYFQHGAFKIYPNFYTMLIGEPGARKSTAIKLAAKLLRSSGYTHFAPSRTTKEKFLDDLQGDEVDYTVPTGRKRPYDPVTATNLWSDSEAGIEATSEPSEVLIAADEFNNFMPLGDMEFHSILGELWDYEGIFRYRIRNGKSVSIPNPTISILGGNTQENFARMFPPEIIGQGFLSRLILIYGEKNDSNRTTFPKSPTEEQTLELIKVLQTIQLKIRDAATLSPAALTILDKIYQQWTHIPDVRFRHYSTRRFTQLLKTCLIVAAGKGRTDISERSIIEANTYLAAAERLMPKALGEFGKGKYSDTSHKLMQILEDADQPVDVKDLWKELHKDLDKPTDLAQILRSLEDADKIQRIAGKGFLPKKQVSRKLIYVEWELLTERERQMIGV